ncbi:helix-turn-helix domain-containing protein [candidate division WWE3 bacterium]|nr:helix-turn-helix domain-containing protein [candidate division WWE3 bacterium]
MVGKNDNYIGRYMRNRRKELEMTQEDLASEVGLTTSTISLYESGDRTPPLKTLEKIAHALQIDISEFFTVKEAMSSLEDLLKAQHLTLGNVEKVKDYIEYLKYKQKCGA